MKTQIFTIPKTKVQFIDEQRARIELQNGDAFIVGFATPLNYHSGEHFIKLLGIEFDLHWGLYPKTSDTIRQINSDLYRDGYEMMLFLVTEQDKNEERQRIGNRIKELRVKKDIDAKTLAQRVGIDASNLSRIEKGHYSVGLDILAKIANALDAKVDIVEN